MGISGDNCSDIEVARLDGLLRGLSFLNMDFRKKFSEAFFVLNTARELSPEQALSRQFAEQFAIANSRSSELENWIAEVEESLPALLHHPKTDLGKYLSHKVMEVLIGATGVDRDIEVVRLDASVENSDVELTFICFNFPERYLVLYFVHG